MNIKSHLKKVIVNDVYQRNYIYYLTEKEGENFDEAFKPELNPKQMLEIGIFGGVYFRDKPKEFPQNWFKNAKLSKKKGRDKNVNFFEVNASMPLKEWKRKGWIHPYDPRGWFQWYCRYYLGRRCSDDHRQIKRWKNMTRHLNAIKNNCISGDLECRKRQRQAVLHWAYDSRLF